ncbi:MAG: thiamine phosphate synthase [Pirellula sp.]
MTDSTDHSQIVLRRMIDANSNRVMEGLRTLEDVARFSGLGKLQAEYKAIRHRLQQTIATLGTTALVSARDAQGDVGRESKTDTELQRTGGLASIVGAASARVEQGLRVIEEACKVLAPGASCAIERLRYQVYDSNSALQLACNRDLEFLRRAKLYVLVDCKLGLQAFGERIKRISRSGAQLIQIRDKQADPVDIIRYLEVALSSIDPLETRIVINDRVDIAATSSATGVHVGQEDLPVVAARRLLQPWQLLGLSTHNLDHVRSAAELGVDYIGCGPTFESKTKSFESFSGLSFLKQAADWMRANAPGLPGYAIGGIDPGNLPQVLDTGFSRIAVGSCVWNTEKPADAVEKMRGLLESV